MKQSTYGDQEQTEARNIRNCHWCWQEKGALQLITKTFADSEKAASHRSLYVAMTEIASDEGRETFQVSKALLAFKAGLSVKTVERLLPGLEELGIIKIERSLASAASGAIKAPNTYTLSMRHGDATSMRHGGASAMSDKVKERKERKEPRASATRADCASASASASPTRRVDGLERLSPDQQEIVNTYNRIFGPLGWRRVTKITEAVFDVLPRRTPEEWREFFEVIAEEPESWPKPRTLVRLHWKHS